MTKEEALDLMKNAPRSEEKKSKINKFITEAQAYKIIFDAVQGMKDGETLDGMMEKRVYQVSRNQRRPNFKPSFR